MKLFTVLPPAVALALLGAPAALACDPKQQENLLTTVLYNEAHPNRTDQAAVASVVLNRAESRHFRGTLCQVMTRPGQFQYRMSAKKKIDPTKLQMARTSAKLFLAEYTSHRAIISEARVFNRLKGFDSFNTTGTRVGSGPREQIGGNTFYMSKAARLAANRQRSAR